MTNMFMVHHKRKEIWFGYTLQLYLLTVIANYITLGLNHKVISKLSDLNYKIVPVHDFYKTSIVYYDRLKGCHSSFQSSSPLSHSPPSQTLLSQANHNIGKEAELLDFPAEDHVHNAINYTPPDEIIVSD